VKIKSGKCEGKGGKTKEKGELELKGINDRSVWEGEILFLDRYIDPL
jgi:hypothetical protein